MGVDMAIQSQLIAAQKSLDEIRVHIGADSLAYLSLEGMMRVLDDMKIEPTALLENTNGHEPHEADKGHGYCNACFTGRYPFDTPIAQFALQTKESVSEMWGN